MLQIIETFHFRAFCHYLFSQFNVIKGTAFANNIKINPIYLQRSLLLPGRDMHMYKNIIKGIEEILNMGIRIMQRAIKENLILLSLQAILLNLRAKSLNSATSSSEKITVIVRRT